MLVVYYAVLSKTRCCGDLSALSPIQTDYWGTLLECLNMHMFLQGLQTQLYVLPLPGIFFATNYSLIYLQL